MIPWFSLGVIAVIVCVILWVWYFTGFGRKNKEVRR